MYVVFWGGAEEEEEEGKEMGKPDDNNNNNKYLKQPPMNEIVERIKAGVDALMVARYYLSTQHHMLSWICVELV